MSHAQKLTKACFTVVSFGLSDKDSSLNLQATTKAPFKKDIYEFGGGSKCRIWELLRLRCFAIVDPWLMRPSPVREPCPTHISTKLVEADSHIPTTPLPSYREIDLPGSQPWLQQKAMRQQYSTLSASRPCLPSSVSPLQVDRLPLSPASFPAPTDSSAAVQIPVSPLRTHLFNTPRKHKVAASQSFLYENQNHSAERRLPQEDQVIKCKHLVRQNHEGQQPFSPTISHYKAATQSKNKEGGVPEPDRTTAK